MIRFISGWPMIVVADAATRAAWLCLGLNRRQLFVASSVGWAALWAAKTGPVGIMAVGLVYVIGSAINRMLFSKSAMATGPDNPLGRANVFTTTGSLYLLFAAHGLLTGTLFLAAVDLVGSFCLMLTTPADDDETGKPFPARAWAALTSYRADGTATT